MVNAEQQRGGGIFLGKYEISEEFMLYSIKLNNDTHRRFYLPEKIVIKVYLV
jgi:hypothetical protein